MAIITTMASIIIVNTESRFRQRRGQLHPNCLLCGQSNPVGLKLDFMPDGVGGARLEFEAPSLFEGYPSMLHGGLIAALLDSAMTNCLFMHGIVAVTAELNIRYHSPVPTGIQFEVSAFPGKSYPPLHHMHANILIDGHNFVSAQAKFMESKAATTSI